MEFIVRFLLGGTIVSAFAASAELFKPKSFSGLFGAAPSVALAGLALATCQHGDLYMKTESRSMLFGAVALLAYSIACVTLTKRRHVPVWFSAMLAWSVWLAVAFALYRVAEGS
ncbi:MAG: DUF3147 family protein [Kofleriaceae bacterium]